MVRPGLGKFIHRMECLSSRREREAPGGRARENRKFIQAPSPEIWSETISGGEEVLARKWGGLFWATSLKKIFGGVIAIISFRPPSRPRPRRRA